MQQLFYSCIWQFVSCWQRLQLAWPQGWVSNMSNNPTRFNPRVEQEFLFNSRVWTKFFVQTREICMWRARFHRVRAVQPKGWADEFVRPAGRVWTFVRNSILRPGYLQHSSWLCEQFIRRKIHANEQLDDVLHSHDVIVDSINILFLILMIQQIELMLFFLFIAELS
jgi:hypothetical protein